MSLLKGLLSQNEATGEHVSRAISCIEMLGS